MPSKPTMQLDEFVKDASRDSHYFTNQEKIGKTGAFPCATSTPKIYEIHNPKK